MTMSRISFNSYQEYFVTGFRKFQADQQFVDLTLGADGHYVQVHKNVISLASPYLKEMILAAPATCNHPVVLLTHVSKDVLTYILEYVYTGEVLVPPNQLPSFIKAAKALQIVGIRDMISPSSAKGKVFNETSSVNDGNRLIINKATKRKKKVNENNIVNQVPQTIVTSQATTDLINTNLNVDNHPPENTIFEMPTNNAQPMEFMEKPDQDFQNVTNVQNVGLHWNEQANDINNMDCTDTTTETTENTQHSNTFTINPLYDNTSTLQTISIEPLGITSLETALGQYNQVTNFDHTTRVEAPIGQYNSQDTNLNNTTSESNGDFNQITGESNGQILPQSMTYSLEITAPNSGNEGDKPVQITVKAGFNEQQAVPPTVPYYGISIRGRLLMMFNRYMYNYHNSSNREKKRRWRCVNYRLDRCPALVDTVGQKIVARKFEHKHGFHDDRIMKYSENSNLIYNSIEDALDALKCKKGHIFETASDQQLESLE